MKARLFALLIPLYILTLAGCSHAIRIKDPSIWDIRIVKDTFGLELKQPGSHLPLSFRGDKKPAIFYTTHSGIQVPVKTEQVIRNTPVAYGIRYQTSDHRKMNIMIRKTAHNILRIHLEVTPDTGVVETGITLKAYPGEHYFGLTERTVDGSQSLNWSDDVTEGLDVRGQQVTMVVKPTLGIYVPFFVTSSGYGVFVHGTQPGRYDMAATDPDQVVFSFDGSDIHVSVIPGPEIIDVTQRFAALTGYTILPPKWAFLPFRWRDNHTNTGKFYDGTPNTSPYNPMVVEDLLMADALDIPIGTYWVDRPWAEGSRGYGDFRKWDPNRFPAAQEMINWINDRNQHFMVWVAPWACDSLRTIAIRKQYLMPLPPGDTVIPNPWILDFTSREVSHWWGEQLTPLISMGVAAFKMDRSEEKTVRTANRLLNGKTAREMRNDYPKLYLKAAYDIMKHLRGDDFLLMPRAAYTGSQQYGVFWGGDIVSGAYGLRTALIALQKCSFMNFPVWGSDIGGYWGNDFSHENVARWLAFGAFSPIMEVGPLRDHAPWDMPFSPTYDTTLIAIYRLYSKMHSALQSYTYTQAEKAHSEGTPIIRPLIMAYPDDPESGKRFDEYLYGPDILVGIIWKEGQHTFNMYLPEGSWTDAWTGQQYEGKQHLQLACPEYKIPIFIRSGAAVTFPDPEALYQESLELAKHPPDMNDLVHKAFPGTK